MSDNEQRCAIKFCFRLEHNATETFAKLQHYLRRQCFVKGPDEKDLRQNGSEKPFSVNRFLASKDIHVAPQPPYSSELSHCDSFLFPKSKNHLKGHHFGTLENIQTAVTDQLKAIPISGFHQCYEEWKKRLHCCVASEGSYFEGDNVEFSKSEMEQQGIVQGIVPIFGRISHSTLDTNERRILGRVQANPVSFLESSCDALLVL
ncbi:uncharacterized protein TNCV_3086141 [Trichonephila clavipes]|nr:uncharacterized protein TNCV_3086141 [Trichonephila clavipes]